jgi:hypothetical protein
MTVNGPETTAGDTTGVWAGIAPQQFTDNSWLRWWPVAAGVGIILFWIGAVIWWRPDTTAVVCTGIIGLLPIVLFWMMLERSVKVITVDGVGVHARHGLGATTHLPWERIVDFYGGGRYGASLSLISPDARLVLSRRLAGWPELYALVRQARPEFWTTLDPSRLKAPVPGLLALAMLLQLPNAIILATGTSPVLGTGLAVIIVVWFVWYLFLEPRAILLSDAGLRIKFPLHGRFVPRSDIAGFTFFERPFWRRGVKLVRRDGRQLNLGIMHCGEVYMMDVLNVWQEGRLRMA